MILLPWLNIFIEFDCQKDSSSISDAGIYYRCDFTKYLSLNSHFSSSSYEDELIWAAAWLYKATQDFSYLDEAEDLYAAR